MAREFTGSETGRPADQYVSGTEILDLRDGPDAKSIRADDFMSDLLMARSIAGNQPVIASIGDSMAVSDYNGSDRVALGAAPTNILKSAKGIVSWALILCGQRLLFPLLNNCWGFPSQTSGTILANLPAFWAQMVQKPSVMYVQMGTNDVHNGIDYAVTIANFQAFALYNAQRNCRTIFGPIPPRSAGWTADQFQKAERINRWLMGFSQRASGIVAFASASLSEMTDPASVGALPKTGDTYDGTHPGVGGGYKMGKAVAAILRHWYPPIDLLPYNNLTWATGLTNANYLINGMMEGTGAAASNSGAGTTTGNGPTSWNSSATTLSGLTCAHSQANSPLTGRRMHQMAFSGGYTASGYSMAAWGPNGRLWQNPATASLATLTAGDKIEALCEFEIDAGNTCIAFPHLQMRWKSSPNYNADMLLPELVGGLPNEAISGVLRVPAHEYIPSELPLAAGEVTLSAYAYLRAEAATYSGIAGTIRFGRAIIQKVEG